MCSWAKLYQAVNCLSFPHHRRRLTSNASLSACCNLAPDKESDSFSSQVPPDGSISQLHGLQHLFGSRWKTKADTHGSFERSGIISFFQAWYCLHALDGMRNEILVWICNNMFEHFLLVLAFKLVIFLIISILELVLTSHVLLS